LATAATIIDDDDENELNYDNLKNRKLELVTAGLQPAYARILQRIPDNVRLDIIDYLLAMKTEKNLSLHYSQIIIKSLSHLNRL
jgi:hypothetical protein